MRHKRNLRPGNHCCSAQSKYLDSNVYKEYTILVPQGSHQIPVFYNIKHPSAVKAEYTLNLKLRRSQMLAWFLLLGPLLLGLLGLFFLLNIFGASTGMANFYKGRGELFPVLEGDSPSTHRMMGALLLVAGIITTIAFLKTGVL
jgi:hypothetical protein